MLAIVLKKESARRWVLCVTQLCCLLGWPNEVRVHFGTNHSDGNHCVMERRRTRIKMTVMMMMVVVLLGEVVVMMIMTRRRIMMKIMILTVDVTHCPLRTNIFIHFALPLV